jgi:adenosylcobinamide kinase/adenosylcobinamide-phosphate guanylyltransferase
MAGKIALVTGAVRSGKSRFAERLASDLARGGDAGDAADRAVTYVATSRIWDAEMATRVAAHRAARPTGWATIEEPLRLATAVRDAFRAKPVVVLVESVDMWVSNRLLETDPIGQDDTSQLDRDRLTELEAALLDEVAQITSEQQRTGVDLVTVTVEAGWGVVPPYPLGRAFRDLLGRVNSALAAEATAVYLMVAGLPVDVKRLSVEAGWTRRGR